MAITLKKIAKKRPSLLLHLLAWTILMLFPWYVSRSIGDADKFFVYIQLVNFAAYGIVFYVNYFGLVPFLFLKRRKLLYFPSVLVLSILMSFASFNINSQICCKDHKRFPKKEAPMHDSPQRGENMPPPRHELFVDFRILNFIITSFLISGFSLGLKLIEKVGKDDIEKKELEKEKLNSELAFLKNQVSPHFFFNTLNNIYALIGINASDAQESVLKLSKMMRYLLYETEKGETNLHDEIIFLQNYIDLMKLRLSPKVGLTITFPANIPVVEIPPLLFIPLVENAFKHGISYRDESFIHISMEINESEIAFVCSNTVFSQNSEQKYHSGIGLDNLKKRLNLLFPANHSFTCSEINGVFTAILKLKTTN